MYKTLCKYNLVAILPFKDTFFYAQVLPKKAKPTKQLLSLNYSRLSPFNEPKIINILEKNYLMLWFYKTILNAPIIIPESYIIFKELNANSKNAIYIIFDDIYK